MEQRTFDWQPKPDLRSFNFMVSGLGCHPGAAPLSYVRHKKSVYLDQGQEGACTGFALQNIRALDPDRALDVSNELAHETYLEAQKQDEWEGEDYEGSSVNGAMRAARLREWVREWYWCLSLAELDHALSYHGPCEAGTNWYSNMINVDSSGLIHPTGTIVGGHAYTISGRQESNGRVRYRIENSWGQDWGWSGAAWILAEDFQKLLTEGGEVACPTKVV